MSTPGEPAEGHRTGLDYNARRLAAANASKPLPSRRVPHALRVGMADPDTETSATRGPELSKGIGHPLV